MTDRTMIAAMCLQGLLPEQAHLPKEKLAVESVAYADALLKELGSEHERCYDYRLGRNEALEETARLIEGENEPTLALMIRALKKSEVK